MIKFNVLTAERLRKVLDYDPATGLFTYKVRAARRVRIGDVAGSINNEGYRNIRLDGRCFKAHRLAWLHTYGCLPGRIIDHANGNRDDNRISNLRVASRSQNRANSKHHPLKGVSKRGKRWVARIQKDNRPVFLGYFDDQQSATAAYVAAARELFGDFARV